MADTAPTPEAPTSAAAEALFGAPEEAAEEPTDAAAELTDQEDPAADDSDGSDADVAPEPTTAAEALFDGDDSDPDDAAARSRRKTRKRIQQLVARAKAAEEKATTVSERLQAAQDRLEAREAIAAVVDERYGDNIDLLAFDHTVVTTLDRLASENPTSDFASVARKLKRIVTQQGEPTVSDATAKQQTSDPKPDPAPAPAADPRVDKIVERAARAQISSALDGVKPGFQSLIADHIVASGADLADLSNEAILEAGRDFVESKGLAAADVLVDATPAKPGKKPKPSTTSGRGSADSAPRGKAGGKPNADSEDDSPKTLAELQERREARWESAFSAALESAGD